MVSEYPKESVGEMEIKGRIESIQTTVLLTSARISKNVLRRFATFQTPVKDYHFKAGVK